ncbi:MAG: YcaQ family DNA glycosylase [Kofleriaceae bacterium]|nr:YcaQ family DNA glycosylase [Kofleriaceae bacterium]MCB9574446.1 YcaQ family DNA glycosylase [Kofleriaceae bacterium]
MRADLSAPEARRVALAAQGFDRPRPARVGAAAVLATVRRLGLLQLDPLNVLVPAQYLPPFSRLGAYDRAALDRLIHQRRALTEHWAHVASVIPVEHFHLMRGRNEDDRRGWALGTFMRRHAAFAAEVLEEVRARGPLAAEDIPDPPGAPTPRRQDWAWTMARSALEGHLALGAVAVAGRRADRSRLYDLAERVVGDHHVARLDVAGAQRELLRLAARALGVATAADLVDYYRLPARAGKRRVAELVDAGELDPVRVDGWAEPAYLAPGARLPRRVAAAAVLSPFDPLVWYRPRAERLFGFHYRIEIYTPPAKRRWGYYVLPFLLGDRLVARVDLKAERSTRTLRVQAAHAEPGVDRAEVAAALAAELRRVAAWLGLDATVVARKGDLARALRVAVAAPG